MELVYHKLVSVRDAVEKAWSLLQQAGWPRAETLPVSSAVGHVLAESVYAVIDSPPFDRSVMDGFAVQSAGVLTADEAHPQSLKIVGRADVGKTFDREVGRDECAKIATGAPLPRGCDAVVMVEFTKEKGDKVTVYRGASPGENVAQAGGDVSAGDLILRVNRQITSREFAALATQGIEKVRVYRKPTVGVFSTGNELVPSGARLNLGSIYDVNGPTISTLLREMDIDSHFYGILPDNEELVLSNLKVALQKHDVVITSGSTSAGFGDMIYKAFDSFGSPGVIVHGVKLRPGKPTVIAVADKKLLIGLPGFPLSAIMVFHLVAKPLIWRTAGIRTSLTPNSIRARVPFTFEAGKGKRDLVAVQMVQSGDSVVAYPLLVHSGSASSLAMTDGFIDVPEEREFIKEGEMVEVTPLSPAVGVADLTIIGSHCLGVDRIVERLNDFDVKAVNVGSWSGWQAIKRGEGDIAGTHLLDEETLSYNIPFLSKNEMENLAVIVRGYSRKIGLVVVKGNPKGIRSIDDLLRKDVLFVNRNRGSGIRTYLDLKLKKILKGVAPSEAIRGYTYEVKTHTAVAAAVQQGRAECGLAFEAVTSSYPVDFVPLDEERYDFLIRRERLSKPSVQSFMRVLASEEFRKDLATLPGYAALPDTGKVVAGSALS